MPDISKCKGVGCKVRKNCYRYGAKPDRPYQSYANFEAVCNEGNDYEEMIPMKGRKGNGIR